MNTTPPQRPPTRLGLATASGVVVANMIGTGVFTSLGLQLAQVPSATAVLLLWLIGGLVAFCGARVYGELGAALPRSGGEYHYLTQLCHPLAGFLSGWVSATIGFAAPIALAALAFGQYLGSLLPGVPAPWLATALVLGVTAVHAVDLGWGGRMQNLFTGLKVGLILVFILSGLLGSHPGARHLRLDAEGLGLVATPGFAVAMVYVFYAYSGWNAAAYLAEELENPRRLLPRALLAGTLLVTLLYVALNVSFLASAPQAELAGHVDVGAVAARRLYGEAGSQLIAGLIALCLVSSVGSMVLAGPRILKVMGEDYRGLAPLARENRRGVPYLAVLAQSGLALALLWSASFEAVLTYAGFTLTAFASLTVAAVFRLPRLTPRRWTGYLAPMVFLTASAWTLVFLLLERPVESLAGLATTALGVVPYAWLRRAQP